MSRPTTPSSHLGGQPRDSYQLKLNGSRRTNTARVSPVTQPPPAYTANHSNVDGMRPVKRERGAQVNILPTYNESQEPETLPIYEADANTDDVEASVAERTPRKRKQRPAAKVRRVRPWQIALACTGVAGFIIYAGIADWNLT